MVRAKKTVAETPAPAASGTEAPSEIPAAAAAAETSTSAGPPRNAKQSGLAMPRPITDEACALFDWPVGSAHSRVEITSKVNAYVREHALQTNPADRRFIYPDAGLKKMLALDSDEPIMFKDVQKHYGHLFVDTAARAAAAAASPLRDASEEALREKAERLCLADPGSAAGCPIPAAVVEKEPPPRKTAGGKKKAAADAKK